jgi:hypothetical protein
MNLKLQDTSTKSFPKPIELREIEGGWDYGERANVLEGNL